MMEKTTRRTAIAATALAASLCIGAARADKALAQPANANQANSVFALTKEVPYKGHEYILAATVRGPDCAVAVMRILEKGEQDDGSVTAGQVLGKNSDAGKALCGEARILSIIGRQGAAAAGVGTDSVILAAENYGINQGEAKAYLHELYRNGLIAISQLGIISEAKDAK